MRDAGSAARDECRSRGYCDESRANAARSSLNMVLSAPLGEKRPASRSALIFARLGLSRTYQRTASLIKNSPFQRKTETAAIIDQSPAGRAAAYPQ